VEVIRKATWRLLPFLMLAYFIAFVDRVNSGFAALQMNHDIGLSQAAFGLGAGIFCEVPSNLAPEKVGARLWIARIMVTWGMVSALMALVFALSSEWLAGTAAAAGLAQINALGNLAGFVDSFLIGAIQEATHSYALALLPLVLIAAVGCIAVLLLGGGQRAGSAATVSALH
jgi:hypothetical protein